MLINKAVLEDERRNETFTKFFWAPDYLKEKFASNYIKRISNIGNNQITKNRQKRIKNNFHKEDVKMDVEEDEKINSQTKHTICWDVCKNIINLDDFYKRANPSQKMHRLIEDLTDYKLAI